MRILYQNRVELIETRILTLILKKTVQKWTERTEPAEPNPNRAVGSTGPALLNEPSFVFSLITAATKLSASREKRNEKYPVTLT